MDRHKARKGVVLSLLLVSCGVPAEAETGGSTGGESVTTMVGSGSVGETELAEVTMVELTTSSSSSSGSSSTGEMEECGDGVCGEGEDGAGCYEDCGECGDGKVEGPEACDNGVNMDGAWVEGDGALACGAGCVGVGWCGDGEVNGPEACDGGGEQTGECEVGCAGVRCGDGVKNEVAGEACDDGNEEDGDGCAGDCGAEERGVFVSSVQYLGDMNYGMENEDMLTGLALADARCAGLAAAAGELGTYKAWLSSGEGWPAMRFDTGFVGKYRLRSAGYPVVAEGWGDLVDGELQHAVDADEGGNPVGDEKNVWTNTGADGTAASAEDCMGWTVKDFMTTTTIGVASATDQAWTEALTGQACSNAQRLYCFQD
jgi:cysteine-rich repeat protein